MIEQAADAAWTPVPDFPGYEITEWGRVRSLDRQIQRANGVWYHRPGVELSPTRGSCGYLRVSLGVKPRRVHALVAEVFIGPPPFPRAHCRHLNGNKLDNWVGNLAWGSAGENAADSVRLGSFANQRKTHCPLGHSLSAFNLVPYQLRLGRRSCQACAQAHTFSWLRRKRGLPVLDHKGLADRYYAELAAEASDGGDS